MIRRVVLTISGFAFLSTAVPATAQTTLPNDIANYIRKQFDADTRYLDASVDLNGDGKSEMVVHVVGPMACGSGGCPTLVFTPTDKGYVLVSSISITNPPIRASKTVTAGWRNLIVHVRGGGAKGHDAELLSDGKRYPTNPSVAGARIKAAGAGGDVLIKDFTFDDTKTLPKGGAVPAAPAATPATSPPAPAAKAGPSFDCGKATAPVEKVICGDAGLSTLDRSLNDAYTKALAGWPDNEKASQRTVQRNWIASRNACAKQADVKACVETEYRQRLIVVQIQGGALSAPSPVGFVCKGRESEPFTAVYYTQTDPPSAVFTMGPDRQTIAFATRTGSGSRYTNSEIDFWEHQGEATVKWAGATFVCKPRK